ncbi:Eco57I restriction-modification methylase domain-containing protein [Burkholderia gladioli]|uniref:Eco57I restriction-modification methylase domain-containing protein n=1 Tax=Burkholderia gladioli TaxID=28095 RepID=UPI001640CE25|nr:DNA methyltransferase [Burkholderia gladioli]
MPTHNINNQPLPKPLRTQLENTVKAAREVAEKGASAALAQKAVAEAKAPDYLSDESRTLRRRLRAHGRALGDVKASDDTQGVQHLVWEVAYEHWHRMLFARFLAENGLLLWEPGAAVSLDDCEALVQETDPAMNLGAKTKWEMAGKLAARMLPQVFKNHSPVFELSFAPEHQRELERLLAALPDAVFKASDSLGWVYQFWQAKRKDEVNASEVKIGADELPAVTQLFTEPYMVDFLLHNSLGAWWVTRHPGTTCPVPLTYLRTLEDGTPAAGKFEGWPDNLHDFKLVDPCCGSGHFLVAAFLMLVPMRMVAENMSAMDAVDAVLADNLHGLELDARCVEIAVFALALTAWRFPDENGDPLGVRADMPAPQVACCGLKVAAKSEDWMALVPDDAPNAAYLRQELRLLHASFAQAPLLGSLLDLARSFKGDLATSSLDRLRELLERALANESSRSPQVHGDEHDDDAWDLALTARGLLDVARLLDAEYQLVVTNVPYLGREGHEEALVKYAERAAPDAAADLATLMLDRCLGLLSEAGVISVVMPQNWWVGKSYEDFRKRILATTTWQFAVVLGEEAWQSFGNRGPNTVLLTLRGDAPRENHCFIGLDVGSRPGEAVFTQERKVDVLASATPSSADSHARTLRRVIQTGLTKHAGSKISFAETSTLPPLARWVVSGEGSSTGDGDRFALYFWELQDFDGWLPYLEPGPRESLHADAKQLLRWEHGDGELARSPQARIQNTELWSKRGVLVGRVRGISAGMSIGGAFTKGAVMVCPRNDEELPAVVAFLRSAEYERLVRERDPRVSASTSVLTEIPFDAAKWEEEAGRLFPSGLPGLMTQDAAQLAFHGHPRPATDPLQVAIARLAGYRWPAETDVSMELADEARTWMAQCDKLAEHTDDDGIICLPSVRGEPPAHERLLKLLIAAWETVQLGSWKPSVLDKLLADADCAGKGLDVWLRDKFFEQHAKRFHHRPFIWHVWDGLKDGFAALVNYHQLDSKNLERLIHTYLGDWIRQQEAGMRESADGAQTRLAAAQDLKRRLELILEGEPPYDIFVRWKKLSEQPIGWSPNLNDGVRLNIRPFVTAEVLRHNKKPKLNISWDKDRGKDVESAPWFRVFKGERINDHHLTLAEKTAARGDK